MSARAGHLDETVPLRSCPLCASERADPERVLNGIALLRCVRCGFVYANLREARITEVNAAFGSRRAATYEERQTTLDRLWFEMVVERVAAVVPLGRVLDVGCGHGLLLRRFASRGWTVAGVDPSPWARSYAARYGFELFPGTLEELRLEPGSFDAITSTSTFEHVPDPVEHLRAALNLLRPGGVAYFCGMPNYAKLSVRLGASAFYHNKPPDHVNYFTIASLRHLFERTAAADHVRSVRLRSYGIPEGHILYNLLPRYGPKRSSSEAAAVPKRLARLLVRTNYSLGRPLHAGDKLEVLAVRS